MHFPSPHSIDECRQILRSHIRTIKLFSGTLVSITDLNETESRFLVERVWMGRGLESSYLHLRGTFRRTDDSQTDVIVHYHLQIMGYLAIFWLFAAIWLSLTFGTHHFWIGVIWYVLQIRYDISIMRKIIASFQYKNES